MTTRRTKWLALSLVAFVGGCSAADTADPAAERKAASEANAVTSAASGSESKLKAEWQLLDDSLLIASTDPSPPQVGPGQLKVELTADDDDRKFAGTIEYRIVPFAESAEPWKSMTKVREDQHDSVYFEAPVTFSQGGCFIQFHVRDEGEPNYIDLTDWRLEVK